MATVLAFPPAAPVTARRASSPRSLKPAEHATPDFARKLAAAAKGAPHPYRTLTAKEAHAIVLRLIQLTNDRLYRPDKIDLISLAEHLRPPPGPKPAKKEAK